VRSINYFSLLAASAFASLILPIAAMATPTISSIEILTSTVNVSRPAASPIVRLAISGKGTVLQFVWQGPSGELVTQNFVDADGFPATTVVQGYLPAQIGGQGYQTEFSPYAEAGVWTLATLDICDPDVNCSYYGASQFTPQTFKIISNTTSDILGPQFLGGTIKTPTVSLSHGAAVRIAISASDTVSGVGAISVCITPPEVGIAQLCAAIPPPLRPVRNGIFVADLTLPATTPSGVYTVQNVYLTDIAGNATNINNPGQINGEFSGGDTITVTP
jgi:hypothetical protein